MNITLRSCDGTQVSFSKDEIARIHVIDRMMDDVNIGEFSEDAIDLPNIKDGHVLNEIKRYLEKYPTLAQDDQGNYHPKKHRNLVNMEQIRAMTNEMKRELIMACNYLEFIDMLDILLWDLANNLNAKKKELIESHPIDVDPNIIPEKLRKYLADTLCNNHNNNTCILCKSSNGQCPSCVPLPPSPTLQMHGDDKDIF